MQTKEFKEETLYQLNPDAAGRIVLPANSAIRQLMRNGEAIVGVEEPDGSMHLRAYSQLVREVQEFFTDRKSPGVSMVDELIADRRAEAERE
jgi:hypothetical protein